jgi:uncharacterized protein
VLPLRHSPGRLADNVMHFARVLRVAGMPVGSDRTMLALQALQMAGLESRQDLRSVLAACLLGSAQHRALFDQAFDLFWRDPDLTGRMRALLLPKVQMNPGLERSPQENRRLGEALFPHSPHAPPPPPAEEQTEIHADLTWNDRELLRKADFDTMSSDEWRQATRLLAQLRLVFEPLPTRRRQRANRPGRADWRSTLAQMGRAGGDLWVPQWQQRRQHPAPMVVLADISGSMSRYSRMLLHFAHTVARAGAGHVESFVFGTRLTRTTRLLNSRDPDVAVAQVVRDVEDWSGGTRITHCLHEFNQLWARRVLSGNVTVLLITDGLEFGPGDALAQEMQRLHKSCRRLLWLNPLLRFDAFEPRAAGIKIILKHVDAFLPCHNVNSLTDLAQALSEPARPDLFNFHHRHATQQPRNLARQPRTSLGGA